MLALSFSVDKSAKVSKGRGGTPLVNMILLLSAIFGLQTVTVILCMFAPAQLSLLFGKITIMLMGWFSVAVCFYMIVFPRFTLPKTLIVLQWILNIGATYLILINPNGIIDVAIRYGTQYRVTSTQMFMLKMGRVITVKWYDFFNYVYLGIIPLMTALIVLIRGEHDKSHLMRQQLQLFALGILASIALFVFLSYAATYQTMIRSLMLLGFIMQHIN